MTVCTGNICRSPLAELLLTTRLGGTGLAAHSAGVRGLPAAPMTPEAIDLAVELGVAEADADAHRSRYLTETMLTTPDLILAMTRDHRRAIAELAPARLRSTFTVREFARLSASLTDAELREAADADGTTTDDGTRLRTAAALVASRRGLLPPPSDPTEDDVIDPYGRDEDVYRLSAAQLVPALDQVERVVRLIAR